MYFSTAAALLFGLGTRIVLDKFYFDSSAEGVESTVGDVILLGVIQGVGLYYALMEWTELAFVVAFGIAARLAMEFALLQDMSKCALTLLGVAIGVLFTDVLSQLIEDGYFYDYDTSSERGSAYAPAKRKRLVKFQRSDEYTVIENRQPPSRSRRDSDSRRRRDWNTDSTGPPSLSSNSDTVDPTLPPLEREVAVLRARASLADSERRRFKEEKKWAISQGNLARASQMSWQVKRYSALTQSFQREADARLLEVTAARAQQQEIRTTTQRTERYHSERHTNHARQQPGTSSTRQIFTREPTQEVVLDRNSNVTLDFGRHQPQRQRKQSGGTLKSAIRLQVR